MYINVPISVPISIRFLVMFVFFQQTDADCEILAEKSRTPLGPWALKWEYHRMGPPSDVNIG